MAFRKAVLEAVRGFDPSLGPGSTNNPALEDIDLLYRCLRRELKIIYSPKTLIMHNHGRRTKLEEDRTSLAYALGRGGFYIKHILRLDFQIARIAIRELYDLAKTLTKGVITRTQFPYHKLALPAIVLGAFYYCQGRLLCRRYSQDTDLGADAH